MADYPSGSRVCRECETGTLDVDEQECWICGEPYGWMAMVDSLIKLPDDARSQ